MQFSEARETPSVSVSVKQPGVPHESTTSLLGDVSVWIGGTLGGTLGTVSEIGVEGCVNTVFSASSLDPVHQKIDSAKASASRDDSVVGRGTTEVFARSFH